MKLKQLIKEKFLRGLNKRIFEESKILYLILTLTKGV